MTADQEVVDINVGIDLLRVECRTCTSTRSLPRLPYPVKIQHVCDRVEPGRAFWAMFPEEYESPTAS